MKKQTTDSVRMMRICNKDLADLLASGKKLLEEDYKMLKTEALKIKVECMALQAQLMKERQENERLEMMLGEMDELLQILEKECSENGRH